MGKNFESCVLEQGKGHEAVLKSLLLDQRELQCELSDLFVTLGPDLPSSLEVVTFGDDTLVAEDEKPGQQKDDISIYLSDSYRSRIKELKEENALLKSKLCTALADVTVLPKALIDKITWTHYKPDAKYALLYQDGAACE